MSNFSLKVHAPPPSPVCGICAHAPSSPWGVRHVPGPPSSPDKASDIRASANVLELAGSGFGKGAIGVTYRRDLDAMPVRVRSAALALPYPLSYLPFVLRVLVQYKHTAFCVSVARVSSRVSAYIQVLCYLVPDRE